MKVTTFIHTSNSEVVDNVSNTFAVGGYAHFYEPVIYKSEHHNPNTDKEYIKLQSVQIETMANLRRMIESDTIMIDVTDWNPHTWFIIGMAYRVAWEDNDRELIFIGTEDHSLQEIQTHLENWADADKTWVNGNPVVFEFNERRDNLLEWVRLGYLWGDPNNNYFIMTKLAGEGEHELDYRFRYYSTNTSYEKAR